MKTIVNDIWRVYLIVIAIGMLFSVPVIAQNDIAYSDVDSIGDIWIFVVDASGSMTDKGYKNKWNKEELSEFVMDKLNRLHILDMPNYERDRFFMMYSGIYKGSIDNNKLFLRNQLAKKGSFTYHFMHPHPGNENVHFKRENLERYLRTNISTCDFSYKFSCVSQIRTCALDTVIHKMISNNMSNSYNYIYIVTVTDDSDINDQWRKEYKEMMSNAPQRIPEINALNKRYIHSPFQEDGGGELIELATTFAPSSKAVYAPKIWLHQYVTQQQQPIETHLSKNELLEIAPMDGSKVLLRVKVSCLKNDPIDFIYLDTICVNGEVIPVKEYMKDSLFVNSPYANNLSMNDVQIKGNIQVQYTDSILGSHAKKIDFIQSEMVPSTLLAILCRILLIMVICALLSLAIYFLTVLPNKRVMDVYTSEGHKLHVRRGYSWQWQETLNPVLFSSIQRKSDSPIRTALAKHHCYRPQKSVVNTDVKPYFWLIDSSCPLVSTAQFYSIDSSMDIMRYVQREVHCPKIVKDLYNGWILLRIDNLSLSQNKWIRKFGRFLQRAYHKICPHYLYWINVYKADESVIVTSPLLPDSPFLLERLDVRPERTLDERRYLRRLLSQYYASEKASAAEVLVTVEIENSHTTWNVFQLNSRLRYGNGISSVKHMMQYTHDSVDLMTRRSMAIRLRKAICKELHVSNVAIYYPNDEPQGDVLPFQIEKNAYMSYMYLVDDTTEQKSHLIYSPLSDLLDTDNPRKMVALRYAQYDMELFTSLLPFKSSKDMPVNGAARRESTQKFPAGSAMQGELRIKNKQIYFLNKNINTH